VKLSIELSESQLQKLREEAGRRRNITRTIGKCNGIRLLATQDNDVRAAVDHVLRKNEELYRRLS
jgi:hypothetical protein